MGFIDVKLNDVVTRALVDTGSDHNVVQRNIDILESKSMLPITMRNINGDLVAARKGTAKLQLMGSNFASSKPITIPVAQFKKGDVNVIGMPLLESINAVIDCKNKILHVGTTQMKIESESSIPMKSSPNLISSSNTMISSDMENLTTRIETETPSNLRDLIEKEEKICHCCQGHRQWCGIH